MTQIEKLANEHGDIWRCPIEKDDLKAAYEAGFRKAREMSAEIVHRMNGGDEDLVYRTIDGLGESEAK